MDSYLIYGTINLFLIKNNSSNTLFLTFILIGIIISVSSNNWLGCWIGIEINLISFLPIIINRMRVYSSESIIKYFIIQRMGSSLLFFSLILIFAYNISYLIIIRLLIKIGCPPFHLWFPSVIEGLTWFNCFLLRTVQKLVPIILISYLSFNLTVYIFLSCVWGSLGGLIYSSIRKIIAYSSIYNLGWIIRGSYIMNYSWIIYYLIYSLTLIIVCYSFYLFGLNYLNQFFIVSMGYLKITIIIIIFISIGGIPPFIGFFPKIVLVYCLIMNNIFYICFVLLISALLVIFFYLRVVFTGLIVYSVSIKHITYSLSWLFYLFGIIRLFGLLIILILVFYF